MGIRIQIINILKCVFIDVQSCRNGRPSTCSVVDRMAPTYWDKFLPASNALKEHDYIKTQEDRASNEFAQRNPDLVLKFQELQSEVNALKKENLDLKRRKVSIENIQENEQLCRFYTGFPNYRTFKALFNYLKDIAETKSNWRGSKTVSTNHFSDRCQNKPGPDAKLTLEEEFLMVMMRLKVGLLQQDLAHRFGLAESTVSRIFTTWINIMFIELKCLCEMPGSESSEKAKQFSQFPMLRVILDCTELYTEQPSSFQARKAVYSNYKSHTTFKYLVGISPHPAVTYVSPAWGGRSSDKFITAQSEELLEALNPGEQVMVDRGFAIESILVPKGVSLVIPDFKGQGRSQLTELEGKNSERIAEVRIHVERAMQRIKVYHILDGEFKLSMAHLADQIFTVCAYLVNFQTPFLK